MPDWNTPDLSYKPKATIATQLAANGKFIVRQIHESALDQDQWNYNLKPSGVIAEILKTGNHRLKSGAALLDEFKGVLPGGTDPAPYYQVKDEIIIPLIFTIDEVEKEVFPEGIAYIYKISLLPDPAIETILGAVIFTVSWDVLAKPVDETLGL